MIGWLMTHNEMLFFRWIPVSNYCAIPNQNFVYIFFLPEFHHFSHSKHLYVTTINHKSKPSHSSGPFCVTTKIEEREKKIATAMKSVNAENIDAFRLRPVRSKRKTFSNQTFHWLKKKKIKYNYKNNEQRDK